MYIRRQPRTLSKAYTVAWLVALMLVVSWFAVVSIYPQNAVGASESVYSAQTNESTAVSLSDWTETLPAARGAYGSASPLIDASGNFFVAIENENVANSNENWLEIARYNPAGAITGRWIMNPGSVVANGVRLRTKIDDVSITYSGRDVVGLMTVHTYEGARVRDVQVSKWPGAFDFSPTLMQQQGGAGAFVPIVQQANCEPVNYTLIQDMVTRAEGNILRQMRAELPGIISAALTNKGVVTENMFNADITGSFKIWRQLVNTANTGAQGALDARYGTVTPRPTVTSTPTKQPTPRP